MSRASLLRTAALCATAMIAAPAAAQILGGGVGGAVGGTVGGAIQAPLGAGLGAQGALSGSLDAAGRLPGETIVSRTRDATGRAVTVTRDTRGRLFATTRNARGRIIERTRITPRQLADLQAGVAVAAPLADVAAVVPAPPVVDVRRRDAIIASGVSVLPPSQIDVYMDRQIMDLRRELRGTDVEVERRGDRIVLLLPSDITFAFDKSEIQPRFRPVLDSIARTLNAYPSTYVDVTGHADAIGTDAYNQRLSERRAAAVSAYLRQRGAVPARLHAEGRGEQDPVASNATVSGRAANRRVEIDLTPVVG